MTPVKTATDKTQTYLCSFCLSQPWFDSKTSTKSSKGEQKLSAFFGFIKVAPLRRIAIINTVTQRNKYTKYICILVKPLAGNTDKISSEGKFTQKRFISVCKNNTSAGNPVSCQVLHRYMSCCRTLPYLLSEASRWFHLTCSEQSSALLGVNCHGANTDSLNHKYS